MVAHLLPKQRVAGSIPVSRSNSSKNHQPSEAVVFLFFFVKSLIQTNQLIDLYSCANRCPLV